MTGFPNLAEVRECDTFIEKELNIAQINVHDVGYTKNEVPFRSVGVLNNFLITRGWYYYHVSGKMPMKLAAEMYDKYKTMGIRVEGHCGNPDPREYCEGQEFVTGYHVDSQEGLNIIAEYIRKIKD